MLDELHVHKVFSKMNLRSAGEQFKMKQVNEHKTDFKIMCDLSEWPAMPFGLSNFPSIFIRLMTKEVLRPFIEKLILFYFDCIVAYNHEDASCVRHFTIRIYFMFEKRDLFSPYVIFLSLITHKRTNPNLKLSNISLHQPL